MRMTRISNVLFFEFTTFTEENVLDLSRFSIKMEINIEVRRKQLENLDQFISSSRDRVESILDYLGWTAEKINESHKEMVKCLINPNHRIPASKASEHVQECSLRKEGYSKSDKLLSEPNYTPGSTIVIDDVVKVQILNQALAQNPTMKTGWRSTDPVPRTSDRLVSTFTTDERLALYDYATMTTTGPPQVPEFNVLDSKKDEEQKNLTPEELQIIKRNAKRRSVKYKTKHVHTKNKNATEIVREVINGQMEAYEHWLRNDTVETASRSTEERTNPNSPLSKQNSIEEGETRSNGLRARSVSGESTKSRGSEQSKRFRKRERSRERNRRSRSRDRRRFRHNSRDRYDRDRLHRYRDYDRDRKHSRHKDRY